MLAKACIQLPFPILVTDGENFTPLKCEQDGYEITVFRPEPSVSLKSSEKGKGYAVNGMSAFQADILVIEFHKATFDRDPKRPLDPSEKMIEIIINSFLTRLRWVTNSFSINNVKFSDLMWEIKYLNDDGSELEQDERFVRLKGVHKRSFEWTALNREIWECINNLPPNYTIPQWHNLILDAYSAFPKIGSAVVLAFSALEIFIAQTLDQLAEHSNITPVLWSWINHRKNDPDKWPNTEEQYDDLLQILAGKSLKSEKTLWEGFTKLRKARNSFLHEGVAIRSLDRKPLSETEARQLVDIAWKIILFIKNDLLKDLQKADYKPKISVSFSMKIPLKKRDET
ncbi:MAG TPA: hypothetical protein VGA85_00500 [Dehalococcoidales bacterium]